MRWAKRDGYGEALGLRRGEPLTEFAYAGFADAERAHLDELPLAATETGADLALGRHGEMVTLDRCGSAGALWLPSSPRWVCWALSPYLRP